MELFKLFGIIDIDGTKAQRELAKIDQAGRGLQSTLGKISQQAVSVAAGFGLMNIAQRGISLLHQSIIGMNASLEDSNIGFKTMLGSADEATKFVKELQQFAAKTPFEFLQLQSAAQRLQAFGFEASQVIPMMTAIGDAAAGLGRGQEGIQRITLALGQMRAKSKVSAEEMMQLTEAGIPGWQYLADAMGVTTAEVMKFSQKGMIPANEAIQVMLAGMEKQFPGMMKNMENTWEGINSTLKDNFTMTMAAMSRGLFNATKDQLRTLRDFTNEISRVFDYKGMKGVWETFIPADLRAQLEPVIGAIALAFQKIGAAIKAVLPIAASLAINLGAAFAPVAIILVELIGKIADFANVITQHWSAIGPILTAVLAIFMAYKGVYTVLYLVFMGTELVRKGILAIKMVTPELLIFSAVMLALGTVAFEFYKNWNVVVAGLSATGKKWVAIWDTYKFGALGAMAGLQTGVAKALDATMGNITRFMATLADKLRPVANWLPEKQQAEYNRIVRSLKVAGGTYSFKVAVAESNYSNLQLQKVLSANEVYKQADIGESTFKTFSTNFLNDLKNFGAQVKLATRGSVADFRQFYDSSNTAAADTALDWDAASEAIKAAMEEATGGSGKAGKKAAEAAAKAASSWSTAGAKIQKAMEAVAGAVGTADEEKLLSLKNQIEEVVEDIASLPGNEKLTGNLRAALDQVNDTVMYGTKESWMMLMMNLREAMLNISDMAGSEAKKTAAGIERAFAAALLAVQEAMQKIEEARLKAQIESLNKLYGLIGKAIKAELEAEKKAAIASLSNDIAIEEQRVKTKLAGIEKVKNARVKALSDEIRALQDAEDERERQAEDNEANQRIAELRVRVSEARTFTEREDAQQALAEAIASNEERLRKRQVNATIAAKQAEIALVEDAFEADKKAIENSFDTFKTEKQNRIKYLEETYYPELLDEARINAQAEQLIVTKNQEEMLRLLMGYKEGYAEVGKSFGESLLGGATPYVEQFSELITNALGITPANPTITPEQQTAHQTAESLRTFLQSAGYAQGAADISSYNAAGAQQWYNTYIKDRTDLTAEVKAAFAGIVQAKQQYESSGSSAGTASTNTGGSSGGGSGSGKGVTTTGTYTMGTDAGKAIYDNVSKNGGTAVTSDGTTITKDSSGKVIAVTKTGQVLEVKKKHEGGVIGRNVGTPIQDFIKTLVKLRSDESLNILQYGEEVIPSKLVNAFNAIKMPDTGFSLSNAAFAGTGAGGTTILVDVHDNSFKDGTDLGNRLELALRRRGI